MKTINATDLFETGSRAAASFGFSPIQDVMAAFDHMPTKKIKMANRPEAKYQDISSLLRLYLEKQLHLQEEPASFFVYHSNIHQEPGATKAKRQQDATFSLTAVGVNDPFAEAFLICAARNILKQMQVKNYTIRINSLGDKQTAKNYFTQCNAVAKKNMHCLSEKCRRAVTKSIVDAHPLLFDEEHSSMQDQIQVSLRFLSETANKHLYNIIEYFDSENVPYTLASDLVDHPHICSNTIFEIATEDAKVSARGGRYDELSNYLYKKEVPVLSISITIPEKVTGTYKPKPRRNLKPKVFFVHAGLDARLRSLDLLNTLIEANIPVAHRLYYPEVMNQLDSKAREFPHIIIYGQHEVENDIIRVRRNDTRAITSIKLQKGLHDLKSYLRTH